MAKWELSDLINISALQTMMNNLYIVTGIQVGIFDGDNNLIVKIGSQDICTNYHSVHPVTCERCRLSDKYIKQHLHEGDYVAYKCLNNLWDIALPIIVSGEHIATLFVGQFFYEDEVVDVELFKKQAVEFGFDEEEYLSALYRVPIISRGKIKHIMEYYKGLVATLVESSMARIQCMQTDEKLRNNEVRLNNLFQSMRDDVFVINDEGVFTEYYKGSDMTLYVTSETFLGKKYEKVMPIEVSDLITDAIDKLKRGKIAEPFDYSLTVGDETLWYSAQLSKVKGEGEKINEVMAVVRNITDKKKYEKQLLKAKRAAEAANEMKNIFLATMSHELRTPINVILSAMQLFELNLKNNLDTNLFNGNNHLKAIKQNCYRLLRLTNNLIDITKIESGFMNLNLKNINIVSIVEDITMSVAEYAKNKDLYVQFDTEIEEKIMALDPDKIERIMLNLLSNAIKCTKKSGSIFVNVYDKGKSIKISVKDTGTGIPHDKINQIFERFIQVENTLIKSHEGSGIGLSIVKSFVEMHGGTINVFSELGVGSEFSIEFPVEILQQPYQQECAIATVNSDYVEMLNIEFSDIYF